MICKSHVTSDNRLILALCDDDLIGKRFEEGDIQLDLKSNFYAGEKIDEAAAREFVKKAWMINAAGAASVALCENEGILEKKRVSHVKGIPYAHILRL